LQAEQTVQEIITSDSAAVWSEADHAWMRRALELAARGVGQVSPSPLVGCVIVNSENRIVGEGFYVYEQLAHAEKLALDEAGPQARGATAYVSLEPHAHYSRTPPCTEALIEAGIKRVVVALRDPNPKVNGRGLAQLREAGVEVQLGICADEAARLNEKYLHFTRTNRPFVHLKLATSLDGRTATRTNDSRWITGAESRARVHELRHEYDAILVGAGTALADDPLLTDRSGSARRRPLARVILDETLRLSPLSRLAQTSREAPVLVFASEQSAASSSAATLAAQGVEIIADESGGRDIGAVLRALAGRSLQSVLIEGGAAVAGAFLDQKLVDKVSFFIAPIIIGGRDALAAIGGNGVQKIKDAVNLRDVEIRQHGRDVEITGYTNTVKSEE
jgi:diaminohydroxyphosphoribosylaminopyrimidine deaminase / 5-amino-6-(5-phosphoribosylamino)uracil reductase